MTFDPDAAATGDGIYGLPHSPDEAQVVVIPVPWEATTSYGGGTVEGPRALREASRQVDLFDVETGRPYEAGIAMLDEDPRVRAWNEEARRRAKPIIEAGGADEGDPALAEVNALSAQLNAWVEAETERWLARGKLVCLVGGDHAAPLGAIAATAKRHPGMGVLHLDAHADLRVAYEGFTDSHASIMHNVLDRVPGVAKLVQVGLRDVAGAEHARIERDPRIEAFFDADLAAARFEGETWAAQCALIVEPLPREVYLSFDIDGLDPSFCPHTGTPVPGGLSFSEVSYLLRTLVASGRRVVGLDLCEVAPGDDEWDANVGARLLYKMIGWTLKSRG